MSDRRALLRVWRGADSAKIDAVGAHPRGAMLPTSLAAPGAARVTAAPAGAASRAIGRLVPVHWQSEASEIGRRTQQALLLSAVTGVLVGLVVLGFERVTIEGLFDVLADQPLWLRAAAPGVGLVIAALALHFLARDASPATTDEYIKAFHEEAHGRPEARPAFGRLIAGVATIGCGGALGPEGLSIYLGAVTGSALQRRFARFFSREDTKVLMVAGAAAGIAAIFKAPATGALFAIEVPYQADLARRNILPAMVAAAAGYATFAVFDGTDAIFAVGGTAAFGVADIVGALAVGLLCGGGARLFSTAARAVKSWCQTTPVTVRVGAAAGTLAFLVLVSNAAFDQPLSLGPGFDAVRWASDAGPSVWLVALLLLVRSGASLATRAGGGVGGLVLPLVVAGALTGRLLAGVFGVDEPAMLLVVGMAAFLGAGYRTPLAAVMLVAETTGRLGYVVPALIATAAAQLVVGNTSVSPFQRSGRLGHLERRFELPISAVLETDVRTVPPDATIEEFLNVHLVGYRRRAVPVVEGESRYLGLAMLEEVVAIRREAWATTEIRTIARVEVPVGRTTWLVRDVVRAMEAADTDVLPVVDGEDRFVGVVTTEEVLRLDEILDRTSR